MNCKFIWYNLPKEIKKALNITLLYNWNRIPIEINKYLREAETNNLVCYNSFFPIGYKTNWFNLLQDLEKVCSYVLCNTDDEVQTMLLENTYLNENECELSTPIVLYISEDNHIYLDEEGTEPFEGVFYQLNEMIFSILTNSEGLIISSSEVTCEKT